MSIWEKIINKAANSPNAMKSLTPILKKYLGNEDYHLIDFSDKSDMKLTGLAGDPLKEISKLTIQVDYYKKDNIRLENKLIEVQRQLKNEMEININLEKQLNNKNNEQ